MYEMLEAIENGQDVQKVQKVEQKKKEPSIFDTMKTLFSKQYYPSEHDIKKIPSYIMVNWIASVPQLSKISLFLDSKGADLPINLQFKFAYYAIPKMRAPKYPKKLEDMSKDIELLMYKYDLSLKVAKGYLNVLPQEEMQKIRDEYKYFDIT